MIDISIIIPVYNAGKYLPDTLESVRQQNFANWECICINDGSTDGSAGVIAGFVASDKRFRLIGQANSGVSVARNVGLDAATGKYVAFLDQDDLMPPSALGTMFVLAEKYHVDLVRGRRKNIPENYELGALNHIRENTGHKLIPAINVLGLRMLPRRWMYIWLCLFRRDFLNGIRFYPQLKSGAEDNIFMFEVFNRVQALVQCQNLVCLHRKSLTSTTQNGFKLSHVQTIELAVGKFHELLVENDNQLSRYLFKKQMRNFFRGSVYKSLETKQYIVETQEMLHRIYPCIKPVLKLKHRLMAYFFARNNIKIALFVKNMMLF
ncbi:MAG TPA: glycosyltransferase [Paludibacter sp.]|nr:glycosyltransferase [Paludibacter sp.]